MTHDYVARTIAAYDNAPDKFVSATQEMTNYPEMQTMLAHSPAAELPFLTLAVATEETAKHLQKWVIRQ